MMLISVILLWLLPVLSVASKAKTRSNPLLPQSKHHGQCSARHQPRQQHASKVRRRSSKHAHKCPVHRHPHHSTKKTKHHHGKPKPTLPGYVPRPAMPMYSYKGEPLQGSYPILPDQTALPALPIRSSTTTSTITVWVTSVIPTAVLYSSFSTFDSDAFLGLHGSLSTRTSSVAPALSVSSSTSTTEISSLSTSTEAAVAPIDNTLSTISSSAKSTSASAILSSSSMSASPSLSTSISSTPRPSSTSNPFVCDPSKRVCVTALPDACQFGDVVGSRLYIAMALCLPGLAALGLDCVTQAAVEACFVPKIDGNTMGSGMQQCIEKAIICSARSSSSSVGSIVLETSAPVSSSISSQLENSLSIAPSSLQTSSTMSTSLASSSSSSIPIPASSSTLSSISTSTVSSIISISPTPTPSSSCLANLPPFCQAIVPGLMVTDQSDVVFICAFILFLIGDLDPGVCFLDETDTGEDLIGCLARNLGLCGAVSASSSLLLAPSSTLSSSIPVPSSTCVERLPDACEALLPDVNVLEQLDTINDCKAQLENVGLAREDCFRDFLDTGSDTQRCLRNSIEFCAISSSIQPSTLSSSLLETPTSSSSSSCLEGLPIQCEISVDSEADTATIDDCKTQLNAARQSWASNCFTQAYAGGYTGGTQFEDCLRNNLDICIVVPSSSSVLQPTPTPSSSTTPSTLSTVISSSSASLAPSNICSAGPSTPPQATCLATLPSSCQTIANFNGLALLTQVPLCTVALASANLSPETLAATNPCLSSAAINIFTQGSDIVACLQNAIHICGPGESSSSVDCIVAPTSSVQVSSSSLSSSSSPVPTPTPQSCINSLPAVCFVSPSGLLAPVLLTVDTLGCQLALTSLDATTTTSNCFGTNFLSTATGQAFQSCLGVNVLLCGE